MLTVYEKSPKGMVKFKKNRVIILKPYAVCLFKILTLSGWELKGRDNIDQLNI